MEYYQYTLIITSTHKIFILKVVLTKIISNIISKELGFSILPVFPNLITLMLYLILAGLKLIHYSTWLIFFIV
jgi:hypothetical protein